MQDHGGSSPRYKENLLAGGPSLFWIQHKDNLVITMPCLEKEVKEKRI